MENKFYEEDKASTSRYINKAEHYGRLFRQRPYGEKNKSIYQLTQFLRCALPIISVLTGVQFIKNIFAQVSTPLIACAIAVVLIFLVEYIKSLVLMMSFQNKYRGESSFLLWIIVLTIGLSSLFLSTRGGFEWFVHQSNQNIQQERIQTFNEVRYDSVQFTKAQEYQTKIDELNQHRKKRWGGMLTTEENQQILFYQKKLDQLETDKKLHSQKIDAFITHKQDDLLIPIIVILLCCTINDLLIFWSNWYVVYYKYKVVEEVKIITNTSFTSKHSFHSLFNEVLSVQTDKNLEKQVIVQGNQGVQSTNDTSSAQDAHQEQKIIALKKAIQLGCRDMRKLCGLGFNPKQVKEALNEPNY
ncbi:hypothetical protein [Flammeovirga sp. OC4]|uniref:hypothetical protein n=1 Tax=Flammeovirga sp. OC4 TaxID=1382345 RepID=UPI0005C477EE|nr:hypothetical protein [Flammeovirga sp. OC4]